METYNNAILVLKSEISYIVSEVVDALSPLHLPHHPLGDRQPEPEQLNIVMKLISNSHKVPDIF